MKNIFNIIFVVAIVIFCAACRNDVVKKHDEFLKEKLVEQPGEFPWYLPHLRKVGFLRFDAEKIRKESLG